MAGYNSDRLDVVPSQMTRIETKAELESAKAGHDLLKKKSDELNHYFRKTFTKLVEVGAPLAHGQHVW